MSKKINSMSANDAWIELLKKNRFEHIIHDDCQFIDLILENSEEITISELASEIADFVKEKK